MFKFTSNRPTPNFRWIGLYIQADCCEGGYSIHLGLWWRTFNLYRVHKHEEN